MQVVWRADLSRDVLYRGDLDIATAIVTAVRPSNLEAISLPFATARAWLAGEVARDLGDTEGAAIAERQSEFGNERTPDADEKGRPALRWKGDESEIVFAQSDTESSLRPGDTIIVPASYGGLRSGCFEASASEAVRDRAEQAQFLARARPVLRLHAQILEMNGLSLPLDEPEEARDSLARLASNNDWPKWKRLWAERLGKGRGSLVVPGDLPWSVIEAKRVPTADLVGVAGPEETLEDGAELTTDGDDSFCAGRAVSLSEHSSDVETFAREYAIRCGLGACLAEHVALAAWLHDIGKADRRFQIMLRGGSEIEFFKDETPWAKSAMPSGARSARKLARERSGYPSGGYFHAVQSVAMLNGQEAALTGWIKQGDSARKPDLDLVLHLVASHHGECRPFAPVVVDSAPITISLAGHVSSVFGKIDFSEIPSNPELHRLDSPLGDRFWKLVMRYGWQELCWLEAILRLADHRASEEEQNANADA